MEKPKKMPPWMQDKGKGKGKGPTPPPGKNAGKNGKKAPPFAKKMRGC